MKFTIPIKAKPFVMLTQKTKYYTAGQAYKEYKETCYQYMIVLTDKEERDMLEACEYLSLSIVCYMPMNKEGKLTGQRGDATNLLKGCEDGLYNNNSFLGNDKKNLKVSSEIRVTKDNPCIIVEILPLEEPTCDDRLYSPGGGVKDDRDRLL